MINDGVSLCDSVTAANSGLIFGLLSSFFHILYIVYTASVEG